MASGSQSQNSPRDGWGMRAGHRSQTWGRAAGALRQLLLLSLLASLGCFDLDLPTVPATPTPPSVTVLSPKPGDTISLSGQVSVSAVSVNGLSTVSVLCGALDAGARTVFVWVAPPYLAQVDFATCQGFTFPNPDGGSFPILPLTVRALSDAGAAMDVSLDVSL